jgi:hypothetical protein
MRSLFLIPACLLLASTLADAHVEVESGAALANTSSKITFAIAHGCTDTAGAKLDTIAVKVDIPTGVTGVRALPNAGWRPTVTLDSATPANVTSITWTKPVGDLTVGDFQWYELTLRAKMPNTPFAQLQFNITQTCQDAVGAQTVVAWNMPPGATTGSPAPQVKLVPSHRAGWNKFTLPTAIAMADLPTYFGDAQIVWKGNAAYSPSADVMTMIAGTPGVTPLASALASGDEIWVKY